MAVELDHDAIKTRIVDILKASAILFDASDLTKLRFIEVGFPDGTWENDQMFPYCFVTNSIPFESIRNEGTILSDAVTDLTHTFSYDIIFVVNSKSSREAELNLDDFQKLILQLLEDDTSLTGTGSRLVDTAFPVSVNSFRPSGTEGKGVQGRIITLRCIMNTT